MNRLSVLALWLPLVATTAISADTGPLAQAHAQLDAGNAAAALHTLDVYLATATTNPDARFLRGLALVRLNRSGEAIETFQALTHDFPKLPEPYNNLAVLYAQRGDLILARDTLESALVVQPEYAPAHENLGDVYAALAAKAYAQALSLAPGNPAVKYKLSLASQIGSNAGGTSAAH